MMDIEFLVIGKMINVFHMILRICNRVFVLFSMWLPKPHQEFFDIPSVMFDVCHLVNLY